MKSFEILAYGLNKAEMEQISAKATTKYVVHSTDIVTDLIATASDIIIVSTDCISSEDLLMLLDFYREIENFSETVIFIGNVDLPNTLKNKFKIFADFEEMERIFKYLLIESCQKRKKK